MAARSCRLLLIQPSLHGRQPGVRARHRVELTREFDRVLCPQRMQAARVLVHARPPPLERDTSCGVLVGQPTDPEPDGEPAAGQQVQGRHRLGEQRRGGERRADGCRPQPDPVGMAGDIRQRNQRVVHRSVRRVIGRTCRRVVHRAVRRVEPALGRDSTRWNVHSDAYPSSSARRATRSIVPGVAQLPDTGRPNPSSGRSPVTGTDCARSEEHAHDVPRRPRSTSTPNHRSGPRQVEREGRRPDAPAPVTTAGPRLTRALRVRLTGRCRRCRCSCQTSRR